MTSGASPPSTSVAGTASSFIGFYTTAAGAVLGAGIGANASRRHAESHYRPRTSYRTERVCQIVDEVREEQRVTGYRVRYRYAGETYVTYMDRDPGRFLRVRVDVTPV